MISKHSIRVPAKLILSGEHAVVYGAPAVAMAVNRYMTAIVERSDHADIQFIIDQYSRVYSISKLQSILQQVETKGLSADIDFADYALAAIYLKRNLQIGLKISLNSSIPIGCGMGSSAALLVALWGCLNDTMVLTTDEVEFLRQLESVQHGRSSGLDIKMCAYGGCFFVDQGRSESLTLPDFPILLINTGQPQSNTAACCKEAAPYFENSECVDAFRAVTLQMKHALITKDYALFCKSVFQNQRCLENIGVVPHAVQQLIRMLEARGFSAKVCGAGSVHGDAAGIVMVVGQDLEQLLQEYPEQSAFIHGVSHGLHQV